MINRGSLQFWSENAEDGISRPLIIAGPCSAESEEQVLSTARELKKYNIAQVFRSGVWKPRTRPGSFEGVGEKALSWLQKVKEETGLKTTVEVAYPEHVELCLRYGIDMVWIGARTTANPFSVEDLASALAGNNIPVLIKNPVNPDLNLWIGAIERFYKKGLRQLAAIHRGFYPFEQTKLRNIPKWEMVIELKRQLPELPIICDPSHISGKREFVGDIAQKALDLNMDGLMIESHIHPGSALSDSRQQLTPYSLAGIITKLKFRSALITDDVFLSVLEQYRGQIDSIDDQMLELLAERLRLVGKIGEYKKENNVTIFQLHRWNKIIQTRSKTGKELGLSRDFVLKLLQLIHKQSIQIQTEVMKERTSEKKDQSEK